MVFLGRVRPSNRLLASPLHMVVKKNGNWGPCADYRILNQITVSDLYHIPRNHDFSMERNGKRFLSKLNLGRGCY